MSAILFEDDPIGIDFGANTDEYAPEVQNLLPRLGGCETAEDAQRVLFEETEHRRGGRPDGDA